MKFFDVFGLKKLIFCSIFFSFFMIQSVDAQVFERYNPPVMVGGEQLKNPWAGGLNAPQFSEGDFNNDGIQDLFVFDRVGDVPLVFLNGGTPGEIDYTFAPEYLDGLPKLNSWALLRDFDGDGIQDIFCYPNFSSQPGIEVYKGFYSNNSLQFKLFEFPNFRDDIIPFTTLSGNLLNLAVTPIDIPAIDDIDGDGDLDIVTFNLFGGKLELFENQSVERGYGRDSLIFRIADNCWGGIYESGVTPELDLAPEKGDCAKRLLGNVVTNRHAGSTILTLDMDNDGDKEVLLGDVSFDHMVMAFNGGDADEAWMNKQDTFFPSDNIPVDLPTFPAGYYLDVDNDGAKDLIVARGEKNAGETTRMVWLYKNMASNEFPDFQLVMNNFLVGEMLDFGTGAYPVFEDIDGDGKIDLLVGTEGIYSRSLGPNSECKLSFLKNIGSNTAPIFELVDDNWLNFRRFSKIGGGANWGFSPHFGDLNHDGHADLLVGSEEGGFFYAENDGAGNYPRTISSFKDLDVGRFSAALVYDFDEDQLNDVLLSENNGNLNFIKNIGTPESPDFEPDHDLPPNNTFFGEIDLRENGYSGYGSPSLVQTSTGIQIITGNDFGSIQMYELGAMPSDMFMKLENNLGNTFNGWRTDPALAELDNDPFYEMVVGNSRGGLTFYKTDLIDPLVKTEDVFDNLSFSISPNPTYDNFSITVSEKGAIKLTDALGRLILTEKVNIGQSFFEVKNQSSGLYFLIFENEKGENGIKKLILK